MAKTSLIAVAVASLALQLVNAAVVEGGALPSIEMELVNVYAEGA